MQTRNCFSNIFINIFIKIYKTESKYSIYSSDLTHKSAISVDEESDSGLKMAALTAYSYAVFFASF